MEVKIEGTKNWFEMNDTKLIHSNQKLYDKLIEQSEIGVILMMVTEVRITKKGSYVVNDADIIPDPKKRDTGGGAMCTTFTCFSKGWRIITLEEVGVIVEKLELDFKESQKSHNELEV